MKIHSYAMGITMLILFPFFAGRPFIYRRAELEGFFWIFIVILLSAGLVTYGKWKKEQRRLESLSISEEACHRKGT